MDGLIHAALEAEVILNRAKHVNTNLTQFGGGVSDHKMTWTHDKMHLTESVDESRIRFQRNSAGTSSKAMEKFDLFKKLHELYSELSRDEATQANFQGLKTTSYLLEKLLATYNLNTLIINLYPGNKGYSLSLKVNGSTQYLNPPDAQLNQEETLIETPTWPYEEEEILSYIDNEEIPVILLDLLESEHSVLFYSGCVIAQVRDYRQAYPSFVCDTHHVLLRPTNQSILTDAMCISTKCGWAGEERGALEAVEAALVHAAAPPLCLDPRPAVGLLAAKLHAASRLFNTPRIRRQARRFSQVAVNRKRKLDQFTHHHGLELLDLIHRQRAKLNRQSTPIARNSSKYPKKPPEVFKAIDLPKTDTVLLAPPSEHTSPMRLGRIYERSRPTPDCQPQIVEEYILETDKSPSSHNSGCFHIRLSILQRPSDQEFLGELYVDRDHVEGERNGASCRFTLGTRAHASKYITQFTEIFTEEGRKAVRIKHMMPGQVPRVSFTGDVREVGQQLLLQQRNAAAAAAAASANNANAPRNVNVNATPVASTTIAGSQNTLTTRQLPILQAQLQQVGNVNTANVGSVVTNVGNVVGNAANVGNVVPNVATLGNIVTNVAGVVTNVGNVGSVVGNIGNVANVGNVVGNVGSVVGNIANVSNVGNVVGNVGSVVGNIGNVSNVGNVGNVVSNVGNVVGNVMGSLTPEAAMKQQPSPSTPRLSPQASTNQLLAQQLTNPPQPLNTQKMQSTIIHIQHPLMSSAGTSQVQNIQYTTTSTTQQKPTATKPRTTNPAISALVTSLMNSAQQFQQATASQNASKAVASSGKNATILKLLNSAPAANTTKTAASQNAAKAVASSGNNNATILNLLNSAPAAMTHVTNAENRDSHKLLPRVSIAGARLVTGTTTTHTLPTYTQQGVTNVQVMGGYQQRDNEQTNVSSSESVLLERLMGTDNNSTPSQSQPVCHLQGLSLTSLQGLQGLQGLQNVQVQIPGLSAPISLSLNVSGAPSGLLVSVPPTTSVVLGNQSSVLSLPIAQLMTGGVKGAVRGGSVQVVRSVRPSRPAPRAPPRAPGPSVPSPAGTAQFITQAQAQVLNAQQVRRKSNADSS